MITKEKKHLIWAIALVLSISIICGTLIYLNSNPYSIKFEMDNNTKEAIESIEYPIVDYSSSLKNCTFDENTCNTICCYGEMCTTTLMDTSWCKGINYSRLNTEGRNSKD